MSLIYIIGVLFFVIAIWQVFLKGPYFKIIGSISILFIFGVILAILGQKAIGQLLIYLFESWFLLMQLLVQSTQRKYYAHVLPFMFLYSVVVSLFFWFLDIKYFWIYLIATALFLFYNLKQLLNSKDANRMFSNIHFEVVHGDINKERPRKAPNNDSRLKTILNDKLFQAVCVFVISTLVAYFIFSGGF